MLNNRIYVSYINDSSLYLIDVNLEDYEKDLSTRVDNHFLFQRVLGTSPAAIKIG